MVWVWAAAWVAGSLAVALPAAAWVGRRYPPEMLRAHNEVAGFVYAVVGVIYAVLVALMVIAVWEQFEEAEAQTAFEAAALADLYRNANALPSEASAPLRTAIRDYVSSVIDDEWSQLAIGEASPIAVTAMDRLWAIAGAIEPTTDREKLWLAQVVQTLNEVGEHRRLRLRLAQAGLPPLLWILLIVGSLVCVGFTFLFGNPNPRGQLVIVGLLVVVVALALFAVFALEHPFGGVVRVQPESLRALDQVFGTARGG